MLKILSLFTGIGGFEVGLSLSNLANYAEVTQFVEVNPFCQHLLATRFSDISIFSDVKEFNTTPGEFDIVVGGVPCQSFSIAGARKGSTDTRNLFPEYFRIVRQAQPKYAVIENVQGLLSVNYGQMFKGILWMFYQMGYSVEWQDISVASLGGVHRRNRVFILAERQDDITYSECAERKSITSSDCQKQREFSFKCESDASAKQDNVTDSQSWRWRSPSFHKTQSRAAETFEYECSRTSTEIKRRLAPNFVEAMMGYSLHWTDTKVPNTALLQPKLLTHNELEAALIYGTDYEIMPCRKERLFALGNSISPQCAKIVWNRVYNKIHGQTQIQTLT